MARRLLLCFGMAAADSALRGSNATRRAPAVEHLAYGASPNFCLSSDGNRIGNGVKLHLWECDRSWSSVGQNFRVDEAGRIRSSADPAYCVVIDGDKLVNDAKIQLWKCNEANENQRWSVNNDGQIASQNNYGMCMVVDGNHASNGAKIQLWSCSTTSTEAAALQDWLKVARAPSGRAYATPHEDFACRAPFVPVDRAQCVEAAEALRPNQGCYGQGWPEVLFEAQLPSWPKGCMFYGACQGGCSLYYNAEGTGAKNPEQGNCLSTAMICQLP